MRIGNTVTMRGHRRWPQESGVYYSSTESVVKRFFFNMLGASRDNLIWGNPDPEE